MLLTRVGTASDSELSNSDFTYWRFITWSPTGDSNPDAVAPLFESGMSASSISRRNLWGLSMPLNGAYSLFLIHAQETLAGRTKPFGLYLSQDWSVCIGRFDTACKPVLRRRSPFAFELVPCRGIEPRLLVFQTRVQPLHQQGVIFKCLVPSELPSPELRYEMD